MLSVVALHANIVSVGKESRKHEIVIYYSLLSPFIKFPRSVMEKITLAFNTTYHLLLCAFIASYFNVIHYFTTHTLIRHPLSTKILMHSEFEKLLEAVVGS